MKRSDCGVFPVPEIRPEQAADVAAIARITRLAFDQANGEEVEMIARIWPRRSSSQGCLWSRKWTGSWPGIC